METTIQLPDGKTVTIQHEGELTDEAIKNTVSQLGYDLPMSKADILRNIAGEGTRIAGAVGGAIKGSTRGPLGAAIGGVLGALAAEPVARAITPREETLGESAANVALAGFAPELKAAGLATRLVRGGLMGAGLGAAHRAIQTAIDEQRAPTLAELAPSAGIGAAIGAPLEGLLGAGLKAAAPAAAVNPEATAAQAKPSIVAQLDQRKPSGLAQANAEANSIAVSTPTTPEAIAENVPVAPTGVPTEGGGMAVVNKDLAHNGEPLRASVDDEDAIDAAAAAQAKRGPGFVMPKDLAGAKPRYGFGQNQFGLQFDNDLDKALYILAQKTPSKRDADYLKAVMEHTGMTEGEARQAGQKVRDTIKGLAKDSDEDIIQVPSITEVEAKPAVEIKPKTAGKPKKEPETIVSAAVRAEDGTVFSGVVHADAFNQIEDAGLKAGGDAKDEGFLTNTGRYVDREEAMKIANKAKQLTPQAEQNLKIAEKGSPGTKLNAESLQGQGVAPAKFIGVQEGIKGNPKFPDRDLYTLTEDIPGHPKGSSVFGDTLEEKGYTLPEKPKATETPVEPEVPVKAAETPKEGTTTPPDIPVGPSIEQAADDKANKAVRGNIKKVLDSDLVSPEFKEAVKANPDILYERHRQADWLNKSEAATEGELRQLIEQARSPDEANIYSRELENRLVKEKRLDEAQAIRVGRAKTFTPSAQLLASEGMVRTALGDLTEAEQAVAKAGRTLTKEQKERLLELSSNEIASQKALNQAERRAREFFSDESLAAYRKAEQEHNQAKLDLDNYQVEIAPRNLPDMLVKIVQGNLQVPFSIASNVFGNMIWKPTSHLSNSIASMLDAVLAGSSKGIAQLMGKSEEAVQQAGRRSISATNPLPSTIELAAMRDGVRTAAKEMLTGPSVDSYIKSEVQRGFRPMQSFMDAVTGQNLPLTEAGKVAAWDRTKAFIEGTMGVPPEIMFRLLALGDKPFRRAATARAYLEQARIQGIADKDLERFMALPDPRTKAIVDQAAHRAVFTEQNAGITTINKVLDSDLAKLLRVDKIPVLNGAMKVFGRLVVPFRQFPLNYALTALNFAAPHLAIAKSAYYGYKSFEALAGRGTPEQIANNVMNYRRKSLQNMGEGIMGIMMYTVAQVLWDKGLISESPADTSAKRSDQAEAMGASKMNVSGIDRYLNGGDPAYKKGDTLVDWTRASIPAAIFHIYTSQQARNLDQQAKVGPNAPADSAEGIQKIVENAVTALPGLGSFVFDQSFLAGTSSLMEAIRDPDPNSPKFQNWVENMWKAITSIAVPNTVDAVARANMQNIPELRGKDMYETLGNIWRYKTFSLPAEDRPLVLKRDTWGRPIPRTPEGANPYVYGLIDVTRSGSQKPDEHDQKLYDLYKETNRATVYPDPVGRNVNFMEKSVDLDPEDVEKLQTMIGQERRANMEKFVDSRVWNRLDPYEKVLALESIYSTSNDIGKQRFLTSSGIYQKYFASQPDKHTTSLTTKGILMSK